ncbi:MAG: hypothetical protein MI700_12130, partial [Balneolales bacterium]|nr:hypothetical protein [Balneolales bacterium]
MEYVELAVNLEPREPWFDILAAELGELGFESFIERDGRLLAYIPRESFSEEKLQQVDTLNDAELRPSY